MLDQIWVGVDVGKEHHWVVAVDTNGRVVLSHRVANDEGEILAVLAKAQTMGDCLVWTVDLTTVEAALLLAVLWDRDQKVQYLSGRAVNGASASYRGEGKTDAKDARVIADQGRMRRDLPQLCPTEDLMVELRMLTARRADLVADRIRGINRLRQQLTAICPALERAAELATQRGWVVLLTRYQRPAAIRRAGINRLTAVLMAAGIRTATRIAEAAVAAAKTQTLGLPGEQVAAELAADLAQQVLDLEASIKAVDAAIEQRFSRHRLAEVITSMPGFGFRLGAEFLVAIGDPALIGSADRLAAYAGLAPVPKDSGKRTGRMQKPLRYNRRLRHVMYLSTLTAMRCDPDAKTYYQRKRDEGKRPIPAVICLARRRTNVLWALLRDNRTWEPQPPEEKTEADTA